MKLWVKAIYQILYSFIVWIILKMLYASRYLCSLDHVFMSYHYFVTTQLLPLFC